MITTGVIPGCGYHMRGEERPFFKKNGITTLYVFPVRNKSYKAGIEITVYNALRKRFSEGGYLRIVDQPENADASILATINTAEYGPMAITTVDKIAGAGSGNALGPSNVQIASSYNVGLSVNFLLTSKQGKIIWSDTIGNNKSFAASNYLGTLGSTSALINEGEFERILTDLSETISANAEESINALY